MGGKGSGEANGDLLFLDGRSLEDGKITKTKFFDFLATDLSDYSDIKFTAEDALKFKNSVVRMGFGTSAAIPLRCSGKKCFNYLCPLHDSDTPYPLGRSCIYETRLIQTWTANYVQDLDIDIDSRTEMSLVNELVEADIINLRANLGLSGSQDGTGGGEAGQLLKTDVNESDNGVSEITNLHPLLEAKEKASRRRLIILESLVATRREKYKKAAALKTKDTDDASTHFADLKKRIASAANALEKGKNLKQLESSADKILEADWTTEDGD